MLNSRMLFFMYLGALGVGGSSVVLSHASEQAISAGAKVGVISVSAVDQALFDAIAVGDASDAEKALASGANKNAVDEYGDSALYRASNNGSIEIVQLLLDKGSKVNARNKHRNTPLHRAISGGHLTIAELLLKKGANINAKGILGRTPLQVAVSSKLTSVETINWLLANGADLGISDNTGKTALHLAVEFGNVNAVQKLIDNGADIDILDLRLCSPLHIAVLNNNIKMVELLLKNGANVYVRNKHDMTPYELAVQYKRNDIIKIFDEAKRIRKSKKTLKEDETYIGDGVDNVKMKATRVAS